MLTSENVELLLKDNELTQDRILAEIKKRAIPQGREWNTRVFVVIKTGYFKAKKGCAGYICLAIKQCDENTVCNKNEGYEELSLEGIASVRFLDRALK